MSNDVGAVVLTLGEQTTGRALASLKTQTLPVEDVAVVEGVRPFHRALNSGVDRVATPFFLQLDADMVLDPECVKVLRDAMAPTVGIAVGLLRDPLIGKVVGVKMFRRSCFDSLRLRDTVAPEVDFYEALAHFGWRTQYLIGDPRLRIRGLTLGAHRPDYTVDYAFGTYYLLGRLYAHRQNAVALRWRFRQLRRSPHPMAPVARLAMARGIMGNEVHDLAKPRPARTDSSFLQRLAIDTEEAGAVPEYIRRLPLTLAPEPLFAAFRELGTSFRNASLAGMRACLRTLGDIDHPGSLVAEVALGHGALAASQPTGAQAIPARLEGLARAWASDVTTEPVA
jgi:hypothetical protein